MRKIHKVAVLGSGVMGTGIACHMANAGCEVLMLDIVPSGLDKSASDFDRSRIAREALESAVKHKPAPLYLKKFAQRIETGNFQDDIKKIRECDWIIEVIVEDLGIKREMFEKVDEHRRKGSIVSTNTSGIPVHLMLEDRSEDFRQHFLGTHFFNPPRYLALLEIIPTGETLPEVTAFMMDFGTRYLGKETVLCKDTPGFIANRVGVYAMALTYQLSGDLGLTIQEVDRLTGPAIGRPKTGTFRLGDLVGLDVAAKVIEGLRQNCPDDAQIQALEMPVFFQHLLDNKWYGNKSGQGFYKKTEEKDDKGRRIILGLNLETHEYEKPGKSELRSLQISKQIDELPRRIKALFGGDDKGARLIRASLGGLFAYVSKRIPEIAEDLYAIDEAMRAGFGWELGPFEYWDVVGIKEGMKAAEEEDFAVAPWVTEMVEAGHTGFYRDVRGKRLYYDPKAADYAPVPGSDTFIHLDRFRHQKSVFSNDEVLVHDIGDQVLCLEFRSKMNAIGEGILRGVQETITIAEEGDWRGLVIGNHAKNFSVGANLMLLAMFAFEEEWDDLALAVRLFQETSMRCRYSSVPVVAATQGFVFGGSCEIAMHCDAVVAAAESYIGLVEVGVGVLPGGGGTKEFAVRTSDKFFEGDVKIPTLIDAFKTIALAQVGTSAHEAFGYGYLQDEKDLIVLNQKENITLAREEILRLSEHYICPIERNDVEVLGRTGLGALYAAANELYRGNYATDHDIMIARKIAWVLCGGDLSEPQNVTEQYLLDLEREAFLSLMGERKTLERIQYMLENKKPLRN